MSLSKTTVKHLMVLVKYMEKLPKKYDKHFNMGTYLDHKGVAHGYPIPTKVQHLNTCGTTACALGFAATMPYFQNLALSSKHMVVITMSTTPIMRSS